MYNSIKMYTIAITSRYHNNKYFVKDSYINWLKNDFNIEIILPTNKDYKNIIDRCDALLITGGDDIHPTLYDHTLHYYTKLENKDIENMDFQLIDIFHSLNKPVIGICRGIQVINVYFKGTLIQHIPDYKTVINHKKDVHRIIINPNSLLYKYFPDTVLVNSFHHQCIKDISNNINISAISEDGFIEAIEHDNILGVQWHPEKMDEVHKKNFIHLINDLIHLNKNNHMS